MGQALETVTVQHERATAPRQVRISARVKVAIDRMVHDAQKRPEAAKTAGLTDDALRKAMHKPEVLAYLNAQQGVLRTSARARSIARVDNLADDSESDHVKLEANKFLLGIEGITAAQRIESTHIHKGSVPGLTINFITGSAPGDDALLIDGQPRQPKNVKCISGLPVAVPHPSQRNAQIATILPPEEEGRRPGWEGKNRARVKSPG